jgi:hypothetical protein
MQWITGRAHAKHPDEGNKHKDYLNRNNDLIHLLDRSVERKTLQRPGIPAFP